MFGLPFSVFLNPEKKLTWFFDDAIDDDGDPAYAPTAADTTYHDDNQANNCIPRITKEN